MMGSGIRRLIQWGALSALLLTGCGPKPDADPRPLVTWMVPVKWDRPHIEAMVRRFEAAHPEIRVKLMWVPATQYQTKFKTLAAAGQAPDLVECGDVWIAYMLPFMQDVSAFVAADAEEIQLDDFYPEVLKACQHEGRYYFLASGMNVSLLYYNRTLFDRAGVAYPTDTWTWDDYLAAGQAIMQLPDAGKGGVWGADLMTGWWGEWLIFVRQAGGRLFNDDLTECLLDRPEAVAGLRMYMDRVFKYRFAPESGFGPNNEFASGKLAMWYGGHIERWKTYNAIPGLDWDIQVLPIGPAGRTGGEIAVRAYGITRTSKHPEAAWELMKFMVSPENLREQIKLGQLPIRKSLAEALLTDSSRTACPKNLAAVYQQIPYALPLPRSTDYIELSLSIIQPEIDRMIAGDLTPEEAARNATVAANRFLKVLGSKRGGAAR
jgi:multiple sugar transport system substrate-binding protein